MNKVQALKHVYKYNTVVRRIVDKLTLFKPGMCASDWAHTSKTTLNNIYPLIRKYKLGAVNKHRQHARATWVEKMKRLYVPKWDKTISTLGNSRKLNISYTTAARIAQEFSLNNWVGAKIHITTQRKIEKIRQYRAQGLNDSEIARCMGVTKEYVRQLCLRIKFKEGK